MVPSQLHLASNSAPSYSSLAFPGSRAVTVFNGVRQAVFLLVLASLAVNFVGAQNNTLGPPAFTAPGAFPTSVYISYYNNPTATSAQVQPVISDPVRLEHIVYPANLTSPNTIPVLNYDPHPLPPQASPSQLLEIAWQQVLSITNNSFFATSCSQCVARFEVAKFVALAAPSEGPTLLVRMCNALNWASDCSVVWGMNGNGAIFTQVLANADIGGYDGLAICQNFFGTCPIQPPPPLNLTGWFAKPKPNPLPPRKKPSGKNLKVLHLSDVHLDPRYATGSEANCSAGVCCRSNTINPLFPNHPSFPAPRFGALLCDTPYSLALASLQAIPVLTGAQNSPFDCMIYTGDLVSHDPDNQNSWDYVMYAETVVYGLLKRFLGPAPIYTALGNHDTYNQAQDAPYALGGQLAAQYSWNYDHVSSLWKYEGWISELTVKEAMTHYAAYSVRRPDGLRIITLNTDMWYRPNFFNYINMTTPDVSGLFRFVTDELQAAEDVGDRVWIMGHVPPGWDGTQATLDTSNLFYQIVDRYSPHVIANTFFGHTHEDQVSIFYQNNGTLQTAETAQAVSWIGPSLTTRANLNPAFRVYEVDSVTFDIMDAHTFYSNVSEYPALDSQIENGPTFDYEYSTRATYGSNIMGWGPKDPLNATWWHKVTEQMIVNTSLIETFHIFQGRKSVHTLPCNTTACQQAKVCYIRSGSAPIALQNCIPGYGSVQ